MVLYEVDLFGCVGCNVEVLCVDQVQSEVLFCLVQFVLQVDVVQNYFELCQFDLDQDLYCCMVELCEQVLKFVQCCFNEGDISEFDVLCVKNELVSVQVDVVGVVCWCVVFEYVFVILFGKVFVDFVFKEMLIVLVVVKILLGLLFVLFECCLDVLVVECVMVVVNVWIGFVKLVYFLKFDIIGLFGYEVLMFGNLFLWLSCMFLFGLFVGIVLMLLLFDGGCCVVGVQQVCVQYDEQVVNYWQQVFVVFCEVEDNFVDLCLFDDQICVQDVVVNVLCWVVMLLWMQYQEGEVVYFDVIDSECLVLQLQLQVNQLIGVQVVLIVNLICVLGGGWGVVLMVVGDVVFVKVEVVVW